MNIGALLFDLHHILSAAIKRFNYKRHWNPEEPQGAALHVLSLLGASGGKGRTSRWGRRKSRAKVTSPAEGTAREDSEVTCGQGSEFREFQKVYFLFMIGHSWL